eukprot:TRINITY_DN2078_c3_g3_i1.p1 TRINITY_DN2078_c3_g3~~TRINITY_DN2078_c3_g3_i1.p1  ORF type:complete len:231 (+),score=79.40 TRINITY_DN2078_c3_g3_i1:83-694(+)
MASQQPHDLLLKVIIIGDTATGKSCLLQRFMNDAFIEDNTHTIGVEFGSKVVDTMGKKVKLQIWDTAGTERYRGVTRTYYRGAGACLIVFDITARQSFSHVEQWLQDARSLAGDDIAVMLVGNKGDKADQREVSTMEATTFAQENGMLYFETSALTGEYVDDAFVKLANIVVMRQGDTGGAENEEGTVNLTGGRKEKKGGCAC